ncbi:hypothetical protein JDS99_19165 [Bacillus cereus group sp. N6]|nr:hypothetical protein [Bacillus cereus group sp. N6]
MEPIQIYLGSPQKNALQVYVVPKNSRATIKQMILTNTTETDAKITMTVNTVDIMKDYVVKANGTEIIPLSVVLTEGNTLYLQQEKTNAINVLISGGLE